MVDCGATGGGVCGAAAEHEGAFLGGMGSELHSGRGGVRLVRVSVAWQGGRAGRKMARVLMGFRDRRRRGQE